MSRRNYNHRLLYILSKFHLLVFQHLEVNDTISLTAVDPNLNSKISSCAHCMCQIQLHVSWDIFMKQKNLNCLLNSSKKRSYRNVRLSCANSDHFSFICTKILDNYSDMIINLEVHGMKLRESEEEEEVVLDKLMSLRISSVDKKSLKFLLNLSKLYQKLSIQDFSWVSFKIISENSLEFWTLRTKFILTLQEFDFKQKQFLNLFHKLLEI